MKTIDLLSCPEAVLTLELKLMKSKELERHTRKLLLKLGISDYDAVMASVIKAIAKLDAEKTDRFSVLQEIIVSLLPDNSDEAPHSKIKHAEVVKRLAIVMMLLVAKKFHHIHSTSA